jgi:hypothetical protein
MNQVNLLRDTLKPHLGWHGARLNFLALFLIALIRVKTVNLVEIATGFRNEVKTDSNYKRLQRFFGKFDLDYPSVAKLIVALMKIPQPWVLSIDRTLVVIWTNSLQHFHPRSCTSRSSLSIGVDDVGEERQF